MEFALDKDGNRMKFQATYGNHVTKAIPNTKAKYIMRTILVGQSSGKNKTPTFFVPQGLRLGFVYFVFASCILILEGQASSV